MCLSMVHKDRPWVTLQTMGGNYGLLIQLLVTNLSTVRRLIHNPSCKSIGRVRGWVMGGTSGLDLWTD